MARKADSSGQSRSQGQNKWGTEPPPPRHVVRLGLAMIFAGILALGWVACLTHNPADPPGNTIWPLSNPIKNYAGSVGAEFSHFTLLYLGSGAYMGLLFGTVAVVLVLMGGKLTDLLLRAIGLALLIASTSTLVWLIAPHPNPGTLFGGAGYVGTGCGLILQRHFGDFSWMIVLVAWFVGLILAADELVVRLPGVGKNIWDQRKHLGAMADALRAATASKQDGAPQTVTANPRLAAAGKLSAKAEAPQPAAAPKPRVSITQAPPVKASSAKPAAQSADAKSAAAVEDAKPGKPANGSRAAADDSAARQSASAAKPAAKEPAKDETLRDRLAALVNRSAEAREQAKAQQSKNATAKAENAAAKSEASGKSPQLALPPPPRKGEGEGMFEGMYELPAMNILIDPEVGYSESQEAQVELKRQVLQQTLNDFSVEAQVVGHMTGPVITLFELSLAPGVKVSQIASLANDIARALAVPGVRIVSPLARQGHHRHRGAQHADKETVRLKRADARLRPARPSQLHLPLYLGKDAGGDPIVADLGSMPHMLIAGTTGSGKSVCINTIIMSLLMTRRPQDVRLILVDPKMVEMAAFETIPHLLCPIVNDMRKAEDILDWAATQMDERYELLKEAGVKNIAEFNRLGAEKIYKRLGVEAEEEKAASPDAHAVLRDHHRRAGRPDHDLAPRRSKATSSASPRRPARWAST